MPSREVKPCDICICMTCKDNPEMDHADFLVHLRTVHGIDTSKTKFVRDMLLHIDGDKWFEWQYKWTEKKPGGVQFQQIIREMR